MDEGLLFLFIGFVVVWLILFIYMFILNMRARRIAKEAVSLKEYLDKQGVVRKEDEGE
jgi:CcmD family protein